MGNLTRNLPVAVGTSDRNAPDVIERLHSGEHVDPAALPPSAKLLAFAMIFVVMGIMRSRGVPVRLTPPLLLLAQRFGLPRRYGLLLKFLTRS